MTIVGNGDLATALKEAGVDRDDRIYFASGVSNSGPLPESEYDREVHLLLNQPRDKHIIYFGSLCIFSSKSRYSCHKSFMENLVRDNFEPYTIVRLGNITWGTNPTTLINHLRGKIERGEPYEVQDVYRYIVNKEEFLHWIRMIPSWSCEMNVSGRRMKVREIIEEYCIPKSHPDRMKFYCGERVSQTWR